MVMTAIAVVLAGSALWSGLMLNHMRELGGTIRSCAAVAHGSGTKDAYAQCLSRHGLDDALLATTCGSESDVASTRSGTSEWANAMAGCIDKRGGHATIERKVDLVSGATTYSVRWPASSVTRGVNFTTGNVTTGTSITADQPSSAP
jgi:hypothetical protein